MAGDDTAGGCYDEQALAAGVREAEAEAPITRAELNAVIDGVTVANGAIAELFNLVQALGTILGVELKQRQLPGGKKQLRWQKDGRIVIPGSNN